MFQTNSQAKHQHSVRKKIFQQTGITFFSCTKPVQNVYIASTNRARKINFHILL